MPVPGVLAGRQERGSSEAAGFPLGLRLRGQRAAGQGVRTRREKWRVWSRGTSGVELLRVTEKDSAVHQTEDPDLADVRAAETIPRGRSLLNALERVKDYVDQEFCSAEQRESGSGKCW